jgi:hypothetical protein
VLGAFYHQISRRLGGDFAVFATARKLAIIIYRLLRWGQPYVDQGSTASEKQYQQRRLEGRDRAPIPAPEWRAASLEPPKPSTKAKRRSAFTQNS